MDQNFYQLLDLSPTASSDEIHDAYRKKSKIFHPDTTTLPKDVAIQKFQQLTDAYGILSSPELRRTYDCRIGISPIQYIPFQAKKDLDAPLTSSQIHVQERPLSSGELFALLILCITFLGCLILAVVLAVARGDMLLVEPATLFQVSSNPTLGVLKTTTSIAVSLSD